MEQYLREKFKTNKQSYDRDVKPVLKVRLIGVNLKDAQLKFCKFYFKVRNFFFFF